ncbi:restriction endonuclease subunit S [Lactobacillus paracasei]|jgi:type I restriction enzyme S subunit|uniref:restriction endonuclease subunit S n=1 Tax=Lacticaseibacillus paracasei TaxID=1597 RepID=UPI001436B31E|nr:restriction endonuclease subunit S [Lacticaseibacillus paracasei]NKF04611.1 restriction endonuclease subunit S [Lacticaseibacillus paracasei]
METKLVKLSDVAIINPRLRLKKNEVARKIPMEALTPFQKNIDSYSFEKYSGGVKFQNGDTLVARITPSLENGKTSYVDILDADEVAFGSTEFIVLRANKSVLNEEYLYYIATSNNFRQVAIQSMTGTSGRQRVQNEAVSNYELELPSLDIQRQIVQILDAVDSKIELNQQINKNLLKLIDGMFNRVYLGSELVKNASRVKLSSIIRTKSGTFNPKKTSEVFVNHFSMPAFDAARFPVVNTASDIKSNKNVVEPFSILVSKMNPDVKRVWLPNTSKELLNVASTEFLTFNADVPEMQAFVYAVVNDKRYQKYLESNATGSTNSRQRVLPRVAYSYEIPYVKEVAQQFGFQIVDIMDMIKLNKEQNQHLIRLRNVLLPKLLAGDIDLSNIKTVMNNA